LAISEETLANARRLDELAQSYLKAEKLKLADAERARAEFRLRAQEREAAREASLLASIRLAQSLRLDPFVILQPLDQQALPVTLILPDGPPGELAAIALGNRPELAESQALVRLAQERLRQANYGPLLPSVVLGYSAGGFGGGRNGFFGDFNGRGDAEVAVFWDLKNLGLGDRALQRLRASEVRQTQINEIADMDQIVAEVAEALTRVKSRKAQLDVGRAAVESSLRSYELNWRLFREGGIEVIRPIEVLQSIQALARARQEYLNTVIEYNRAQFQLYWALGYPVPCLKLQP
jgi:outer membrane protein TolC